jgi:hypothetical protein
LSVNHSTVNTRSRDEHDVQPHSFTRVFWVSQPVFIAQAKTEDSQRQPLVACELEQLRSFVNVFFDATARPVALSEVAL